MQMMETGSDAGSWLEAILYKSISLQILPVLVCQEDTRVCIGSAQ